MLELFEMMSRRVNAVLALSTPCWRWAQLTAFSAKSEIFQPFFPLWGRNFPALRFGYSVISNQFSIDWRGAVGMFNSLLTDSVNGLPRSPTGWYRRGTSSAPFSMGAAGISGARSRSLIAWVLSPLRPHSLAQHSLLLLV